MSEPEDMPVDSEGNRADIVMYGLSTVSRMNLGRLYEHYLNAASRDLSKYIRKTLNIFEHDRSIYSNLYKVKQDNPNLFYSVYEHLIGYYKIVSPKMYNYFGFEVDDEGKLKHIYSIIKDGIYLFLPTDNDPDLVELAKQVKQFYPPVCGPVTYVGNSGKRTVTKSNVMISSLYMMLLEKTGDDWAAVSSAKLQHFGIISQLTKSDKYSQPTRNQGVRTIGETEGRIFDAYCGPRLIAEVMDRNNNPLTHKNIVWNLLMADKPTNIEYVVNRATIKYGGAKPMQLVSHVNLCSGFKLAYKHD